jgi:subtilase family serine protease
LPSWLRGGAVPVWVGLAVAGYSGGFHARAQQLQVIQHQVRAQVLDRQVGLYGPMALDQQMHASILLPLRNQAELQSLLGRLYDPTSPDYRHFLSVAEFTKEFGPTESDFEAVVAFAQANGLAVTDRPANRLLVPIAGTVAQVNAAFHVQMNVYVHPTEKRNFFSPDREPSLALAVPVAHIGGLDDFSLPRPMSILRPNGVLAASVNGSGPGGSYLGSDMRAAYYGGTTLDGNGQAVGLLEFGGYDPNDVNLTFSNAGQTYNVPINHVLLDGASAGTSGYYGDAEQVLDIVQAIGMAPGLSQVRVYIGLGGDDPTVLNSMASENIAKQISCSWSWRPVDATVDDAFFEEMAAQGQSFFTASGDDGAYDAAISPFFYPAEDAYVTAVGGTHLTTTSAGGGWLSETVWNSGGGGSGGGISQDGIAIPSWQAGLATTANGGSTTLRNVPDVAMEGDFDNYACAAAVCSGGYAGTSFAAPRWAGYMALVNEQAVESGTAPNGGLGFINPALYQLAQAASTSGDFHDVTVGNNDTDNQPTWFSAVPGYDLTTGWGSANGQNLINDLAGSQVPGFWIESSQNPIAVTPGGTSTATLYVTDAGGFSGSVNLAVSSALPTGVTASFSANPVTSSTVLTLTASASAPSAYQAVTITGTSGTLTANTNVTVAVHAPSFALVASPAAIGINPGAMYTTTVYVQSLYGFTGAVSLAVSGLPAGVTVTLSPVSNGTSALTVVAASSAVNSTSTLTITGTSGALTATTTVALTVHGPTFLVYGTNVSLGAGSSGSGFVEVLGEYGFTGSVNFTASGLPAGVTASFSPNPTTGTSTVTFTAASTASLGQSVVTITGTSGTLSASTTILVGIYAPTFTLAAYGVSMGQGATATSYVYISPEYGFAGSVQLSISGLPSGVTASFSPNSVTGTTSVLTFTASSSATVGQTVLTITGTSGSQTVKTTMVLSVFAPTFTLSTVSAVAIGQGASANTSVSVYPAYGFTGPVTFSVSGLPSGVTALWTPNPVNVTTYLGTGTLTLSASSTAKAGSYPVTITGVSGGQSATTTFTLGVYAPTFTLSAYPTTVGQGNSATTTVYYTPEYGFTGSVNLSVSGLPSGVTGTFSPNPVTGSQYPVLTLQASSTAPVGQYTLTITGTSGTQTVTTTMVLTVAAPSFTLGGSGSVTVGQGTTGSGYVYIYAQNGFSGSVNLSVSGLPAGATAIFNPNPTTTGYSSLLVSASSTTPVGQYTLTLTGTSGSLTASTTMTLIVAVPSFTMSGGTSVTVGQGTSASTYFYIYGQNGFAGNVNFSIAGLPSGVTASFSPNPTSYSSTLTLTASNTAAVGQYPVTVTGTSGTLSSTLSFTVVVGAPSFTLSASSLSEAQGSSGTQYVYVNALNGFAGNVNLSVSGLPSGVTASFSPNPTGYLSSLTLNVGASVPLGTSTVTLTGTSGSLSASTTFQLTIAANSFTLFSTSTSLSINQGSTAYGYVYAQSSYTLTTGVTLTASGLPNGVTASFSPNPTTYESQLNLTASSSATPGTYVVTINGVSGSLTASTTVSLTVNAPSFTLTATPASAYLSQGGTAKSTISVTAVNGFTGSVSYSLRGVPSGVTATISPNPTTASSTLTLVAASTAAAASGTVTITGTSGGLTASTTVAVTLLPVKTATATSLSLTAGGSPVTSVAAGTLVTATATVTSGSTGLTLGQVNFCNAAGTNCDAAHLLGTAQLTSAGTAVFRFIAGPGTHSYKAVFVGTTASATSQSAASTLGVTASLASATSIAESGSAGSYSLTATVTGVGPVAPAGSVSFLDTSNGNFVVGAATLGTGSSTFSAVAASSPSVGSEPEAVAAGDFNGDGIPDLAVVNAGATTVSVLLGDGDGTFRSGTTLQTGNSPLAIVAGDFNRDGRLDLAVSVSDSSVVMFLGNGDGTFTPSNLSSSTGGGPYAMAAADYNGDGILDLAVLNKSSGTTVTVLLGNGDGSFTTAASVSGFTSASAMVQGDFNGDGVPDLAITFFYGYTGSIFLGVGDGTFVQAGTFPTGYYADGLVTGDLNGDGKLDLAVSFEYTTLVSVALGNGDGTFTAAASPSIGGEPFAIAIGDLNGDGKADLVTANYSTSSMTVLLGNGDGTFGTGLSTPTGTDPWSLTLADWNGDGIQDIAITNQQSNNLSVFTSQLTQTATAIASGVSPLGQGQHAVDASYAGNTVYKASTSGTTLLTAAAGTPSVTLGFTPTAITTTQALTVTVTVSGGSANAVPTGSVVLTSGSYSSGTVSLSAGAASVTVAAGTLPPGTDTFTANYAPGPASSSLYKSATGTGSVIVTQTTPTLAWATPAAIRYGTALSGAQLDATASVPGTFVYTPAAGAVLAAGTQTLRVLFTPTDTTNYTTATASVSLTVNPVTNTIWVVNGNGSVSGLTEAGTGVTPSSIPGGGTAVAIDSSGDIWSLGQSSNSLVEFSKSGLVLSSGTSGGGISSPTALAIDGGGVLWIANGNGTISAFSTSGAPVSATAYSAPTSSPTSISVDGSGSLWITNAGDNSVTEVIGVASPVTTPTATAVKNGSVGTKP